MIENTRTEKRSKEVNILMIMLLRSIATMKVDVGVGREISDEVNQVLEIQLEDTEKIKKLKGGCAVGSPERSILKSSEAM